MTPSEFQQLLKERVIVIDGAMGTMIQAYEFGPEAYGGEEYQMLSDLLVFSRPEAVKEVHLQYFKAGSNAVETNSFGASPLRLAEFDLSGIDTADFPEAAKDVNRLDLNAFTRRLNKEAAQVARQAIEEYKETCDYDGRPLFVLGSIGPSNWVLSPTHADLHKGSFEKIEENFFEQVMGLIEGGADVLLFETQQDMLELKAAVIGAKKAMKEARQELPIICQVTVDQFSRMQIFHTDIVAALVTLQDMGIDAFGINCSIGPDLMRPTVEALSRYSKIPISIIPNAGLPVSENGKTVFKLDGESMAELVEEFVVKYGVNIVGGCCGTSPEHIRAIAGRVGGLKPKQRNPENALFVSGPQKAVRLDGLDDLIRIGERLNVRGSKKVRDAVEHEGSIDQDALEEVIDEQVKDLGVEVIDVCMDSNQVDTTETLAAVIQAQCVDFGAAMCLDSFDVAALAKAIQVYPGRPIVNSISMEEYEAGVDKVDAVLEVTKAHAPLYIALTTGPKGPAVTVQEKVDLAKEIVGKAIDKHGCKPEQFLVDINAFPIGSESVEGMNFALESILSIPKIKALYPGLRTTIGVGNLTNGLAKKPYMRKVLTSVFLDEARKVGLDAAIVNPNHYVPVESLPKEDYQIGLKIVMERDMDAFAELEEIAERKTGGPVKKKTNYADLSDEAAICQKIKDGFKEREKGSLEHEGMSYDYADKIVLQTKAVLDGGMDPLDLINEHLMAAMEELGDGFAEGLVSLPHLLKAADVMKQVMGFLEAHMKHLSGGEGEREFKGTIVLGTVYQDVHSIGKDLAKTLLENYGFRVIDLGVQVPLQEFIDVAVREKADAIGMSALLVQTSNHMITLAKMLKEQGLFDQFHLLIGGAPVNLKQAATVALAGEEAEDLLKSNVIYCNSAMDGVNALNALMDEKRVENFVAENRKKLINALHRRRDKSAEEGDLFKKLPHREILHEHETPTPDFGEGVQELHFGLREILPHLNEKMLFSLNWKYGGMGNLEKKGLTLEELREKLEEVVQLVEEKGWFDPSAVYRIFACKSEGQEVTLTETGRKLQFNPVLGKDRKDQLSFAQFFKPEGDVIALQLTTAGPKVDEAIKELAEDDQEMAWLVQGLSDRIAEDLAGLVQTEIEKKLFGESKGQGLRCSPGYPSMTELEGNKTIYQLLEVGERLGLRITEGHQFEPTGSTAAVVSFHPDASYQ